VTLSGGTRLGPYEILSPLGAGGMGEVYRARDTKLGREVAIKVLPDALASDHERLARFRREAQVLASLNHPRIAAIYGLEETGGAEALVLELVEGETLAERIARGAVAPEEALPVALQIAEGLEYAHERGVVHRDLKPANVKITPEGKVKVLDFGLAKAFERPLDAAGREQAAASRPPMAELGPTAMPTVTSGGTLPGVVMGTASYMSPEQARGKTVDKRADVWAFGCVLYETLAGRKAFEGENVTDTLASLVRDDPDWSALPGKTPPTIRRLLERCLVKDATRRLQAIGDARIELEEEAAAQRSAPRTGSSRIAPAPPRRRGIVGVALGAAALVAVGVVLWVFSNRSKPRNSSALAVSAADRSIAVLPFRNLSGDPKNDYLSDGVSEEILNALTHLPGLKVIGRTSSFRFRGPDVDAGAVGKQLSVGTILSGSVQRAGEAVRVTAELVDTGTGYRRWSQKYDRKLQSLFEVEDEISRSIADALRVELAGGAARPLVSAGTSNAEAHNLFLRAKALALRSDEASLDEAIRLYRGAVALDPNYAAAWSGINDAYVWLGDAYKAPREVIPLAREAAEKAIALDDSLAAGHMGLGNVELIWEWNFPAARKELERALALDPGVGLVHANYALLLVALEADFPRARAELDKAASLDPLNPFIPFIQALVAAGARDFPDVLQKAARVRQIDPEFYYFYSTDALAHIGMGRWADCVADAKRLPEAVRGEPQFWLAICSAHLGEEKQARDILARLEEQARSRYVDASLIATVYAALGERDRAFALLDRAVQDHSGRMPNLECWPEFDPLRSDPRYDALLARVGLRRRPS
jgi:serine/threonine protein kinase/tetratricopeptide (TPR) repeat protein